jgi:DNA-binding SARP family transcriptional activator/Tfp pilus assembly protein PilF
MLRMMPFLRMWRRQRSCCPGLPDVHSHRSVRPELRFGASPTRDEGVIRLTMLELRTLGGLDLRSDDSAGTADQRMAQPKRLALLTYLALADAGTSRRRDAIVAWLWPELDTAHARGALRQALHFLRRSLGDDVVVTQGEEMIAVNPAALWCDAVAFRQACAARQYDDALSLYAGDFLAGFFAADVAVEFEQWIADTREELRRRAIECAWASSDQHRAAGDLRGAATLARRAVSLGPDDEAGAARLIAVLDEAGDRAGALEAYDALEARVKSGYDAAPSPETQALIRRIRARTVASDQPVAPPPPSRTDTPHVDPSPRTAVAIPVQVTSRSRARVVALAAVILAVAGGVTAVAARLHARDQSSSLAVVPGPRMELASRRPVNKDAEDAYIRGRYYWNERRAPSLHRAIALFTESLHDDPTFALAYSAMGDAYVQLGYTNGLAPRDAFPRARAAAERALALDSTLAEPHATLGFVHLYYDWDWPAADREFRRAILLDPRYATAHEWYGLYLAAMGRFDVARAEETRAQSLDPLSLPIAGTSAWVSYYSGDLSRAKHELQLALRADSTFALGHLYLGRVFQEQHQVDSAMAQYRASGPLRNWVPTVAGNGYLVASLGRRAEARAILAQLDSMSRVQYVTAYGVALVYVGLREPDSAFAWLERGYTERTNWMVWLNRDPRWTPIRADPRFASITRRMRLPP